MATTKKPTFIKREQILLTKELKDRVDKKIKWCIAKAKKLWNIDVEMPTIHYDLKRLVAGQATTKMTSDGPMHMLRFHPVFLVENVTDYIDETVPHEMAHIICSVLHPSTPTRKVPSHGNEWMKIMVALGVGPKPGQTWKQVIHSFYNPASLDLPPRRKYGPRKPGGKKVGDIVQLVKKLNKEEKEALAQRLGYSIKDIDILFEAAPPKKPTKAELQMEREYTELLRHLNAEHFDDRPATATSIYGWALSVIKSKS